MLARIYRSAALLTLGLLPACGGDGTSPDESPASIRLVPTLDTLTWIGQTLTIQGTALSASGLDLGLPLTWASSDTTVATVSATGTVTAVSSGATAVTASVGTVSATAVIVVRQEAAELTAISGDAQTAEAGQTLPLNPVVRADDQGGTPVEGALVTWIPAPGSGTASPGASATDAGGLANTTWTLGELAETQTLEARLESGASTGFTATAVLPPAGDLSIASVEPAVLVEGQGATITGTGFGATAAENVVLVDGVAAAIATVTPTVLTVTVPVFDCRPPREVTVTVQRGGSQASAPSAVTPSQLLSLAVGDGYRTARGSACLHLDAGGLDREYLFGALSVSDVASAVTPAQLFASAGSSLVAAAGDGERPAAPASPGSRAARPVVPLRPLPAGRAPSLAAASRPAPAASAPIAGPGARTVPRGGEAAIRLAERALIGELGGLERMRTLVRDARAAEGPRPAAAAVPAVGDTLTLYADYACTERPSVRAVTRHVGTKSVWLDDVENPGPEFTTSELQSLDDVLATYIDATLTDYYGSDADVDANGRVLVLMTKTVNEMENVAGFVWSGDLFPTSVCANSNVAEIFYGFVPDPTGIFGEARSKSDVLATYPRLIAHEVTHVRQFTRIVFGGAGARTSWELEGGATLAEQLVGYRVMGDGSGLDLGFTELEAGGAWYRSWALDLGYYQGYASEAARTAGAPEQCTWIGRPEEGNDGPCMEPQRAVYGVPATLLRFVLDRWGPAYPGGELAMMLRMTAASTSGYATLTDVTGEPVEQILSEFGPILWMDGRGFDSFASWNLWDIFSNLPATSRLEPYLSTLAEPGMSPLVRDGSTAFLRWLPVTAHAPTSLRLRTPSDAPLPEHMILWVVRLR